MEVDAGTTISSTSDFVPAAAPLTLRRRRLAEEEAQLVVPASTSTLEERTYLYKAGELPKVIIISQAFRIPKTHDDICVERRREDHVDDDVPAGGRHDPQLDGGGEATGVVHLLLLHPHGVDLCVV